MTVENGAGPKLVVCLEVNDPKDSSPLNPQSYKPHIFSIPKSGTANPFPKVRLPTLPPASHFFSEAKSRIEILPCFAPRMTTKSMKLRSAKLPTVLAAGNPTSNQRLIFLEPLTFRLFKSPDTGNINHLLRFGAKEASH